MCPRPVSTGEAAQRERERNEAKLKGHPVKAAPFYFFIFYPALVLLQHNLRTQVLLLTAVSL